MLLFAAAGSPAAAAQTEHFFALIYWPVQAQYRTVIAYPDTEWTWDFLGLNPGQRCPYFGRREHDDSLAAWRDPSIPDDADWQQASRGRQWVACYRAHAGTDIAAKPYAPIFASADGEIYAVAPGSDPIGDNGVVVIAYHRRIEGMEYTWRVRYAHVANIMPVTSGPVTEGQLIGYVADRRLNTHLHFEIEEMTGCSPPCIINPWGPTSLWFDDNRDGWPDTVPRDLTNFLRHVE